jgi:hypothetical protein
MDPARFDTLARSLSAPRSRRAALSAAAAGGLLSALGLTRSVPETRAAQGGTCVLAFAAQVVQGPSTQQALTPNDTRAGEVRGDLSFSLSGSGNLDNATLTLADGTSLPVVGQATGHALQVRIDLGQRLALVAVGVGEQEIARCRGAIDGVATGPQSGDLGDWHATAAQQAGGGGQGGAENATQGGRTRSGNRTNRSGGGGAASDAGSGSSAGGAGDTRSGGGGGRTPSGSAAGASSGSGSTAPSCPPGETYCSYVEECRDLRTSPLDCGACATRCPSLVCQDGRCLSEDEADAAGALQAPCSVGLQRCGEVCVDLQTDTDNCGACGTLCPVAPETYNCEGGVCIPPSCAPLVNCGGLCDDLLTSSINCGACGISCPEGTTCLAGECGQPGGGGCLVGLTMCAGVCVDLNSDPANCGACGVDCAQSGGTCVGGACVLPIVCAAGLTDCGGVCVDVQSDAANCGACGVVCPQFVGFCVGGFCPE